MSASAGPLYELTFRVDPDVAGDFRHWISQLTEQAGREEGLGDARVFEPQGDTDAGGAWTCQWQCLDDSAFDKLQDGFFAGISVALEQQFGNAVRMSSRVLREEVPPELPFVESPDCLNCGTRLRGQYCGVCGQRARNRLISLWELVSDAFGDLLELDSRLWRTLIPLFAKPGQLTRDYLEGRRARYMPPFRMYLVLSLVFFVVAFFDPQEDLGLLFELQSTPEEQAEKATEAEQVRKEVLDELAAEGIIVGKTSLDEDTPPGDAAMPRGADETDSGFNIQIDDDTGACNIEGGNLEDLPEWFKRRYTPERLKQVCERVTADGGRSFANLLLDNIPVALIVLLPLMALVLKVLYPLSHRYFVEHLLFVVHYHAFFFLILVVQILFARIAGFVHVPETITTLAIVAASLYIPVYLYKAMRHVYGQGRFLTFLKYLALVVAYNFGTALTMLGALFFALASV